MEFPAWNVQQPRKDSLHGYGNVSLLLGKAVKRSMVRAMEILRVRLLQREEHQKDSCGGSPGASCPS